jgi:hypothetical protein
MTAAEPRCVLDLVRISREAPEGTVTYQTRFKNVAVKNIKRFSRARNSEEIKRNAEQNFVSGGEFALGSPITVLNMISSGIRHFKA